ncbi:MAG: PP2C family protein-serine/threonine phosphatase [Trebonia sp.]
MREDPFFAVGDPGRAALETVDGAPSALIGPADIEVTRASVAGMVIRAASVRGVQHRARQTLRQDAFALGHRALAGEPAHTVAVVCDGVGSLRNSDCAASAVSQRLAERGAAGVSWPAAFAHANEELAKLAAEWEAGGYGGMATTAVAVVVRRESGTWMGEVAWVGDSTLWHLSDDLRWTLVSGTSPEADRDYHSSAVRPMPTHDGACASRAFRLPGGALFAMTDGVANPLQWSPEVRASLAAWWARPPDPLTFAAQVGFAKKTHMDDRTVVGIWPDGMGEDDGQESGPGTADPDR